MTQCSQDAVDKVINGKTMRKKKMRIPFIRYALAQSLIRAAKMRKVDESQKKVARNLK